jgi:hypothetical protein
VIKHVRLFSLFSDLIVNYKEVSDG